MKAIILFCFFSLSPLSDEYLVNVSINNIKSSEGKFMVAVYEGEENYREKAFIEKTVSVNTTGSQEFTISLPAGEYAVAVFQDLNDNEELDKNLVGIPKEPFGFTNKSMGTMSAPGYEDTKFTASKNNQVVQVELKHF